MKPNIISFCAVFGASVLGQWIVSATLGHYLNPAGAFLGAVIWVGFAAILQKRKGQDGMV